MTIQDLTSQKLERLRREVTGVKQSRARNTPIDPYEMNAFRADALGDRAKDAWHRWRRVMTYHGFVWYTPEQVTRYVGPEKIAVQHMGGSVYVERPHTKGQWRRRGPKGWARALTMLDLLSLFTSPRDFDAWIRRKDAMFRAKGQGHLVLPNSLRQQKYGGATKIQTAGATLVGQEAPPEHRPDQSTRSTIITSPNG